MSDPFFQPSARSTSNPFQLPAYDTVVESSVTVMSAGGTLTFLQDGPEGNQVAVITVTIGENGSRTTQRTA